ncbi:hypothetical protein NMG60_11032111 [Bertholletia excelsa]
MASPRITPVIAILLVMQPWIASSDVLDNVCKGVECGKGTCKASRNTTFFFVCECNPGWKQTQSDHQTDLRFLPCVIPDCSLDFSCTKTPPPLEDKDSRDRESVFDPCHWAECGGGTCNKNSQLSHSCECREGYYNLLHVNTFPCIKDCSLGASCSNIGISANKSTSSTSDLGTSRTNQGSSVQPCLIEWLVMAVTILAAVP